MSMPTDYVITDLPVRKKPFYLNKKYVLTVTALAVTAAVSAKVARSEMFASADEIIDAINPS